jgi:hypothetical protein
MIDRIRAGFICVALAAMLALGMLMPSGQAPTAYHSLEATPTPTPLNLNGDPGGHGG